MFSSTSIANRRRSSCHQAWKTLQQLAPPHYSAHNVYLVTKSEHFTLQTYALFNHWSLYIQGRVYHLALACKENCVLWESHNGSRKVIYKSKLKHKGFTELATVLNEKYRKKLRPKSLSLPSKYGKPISATIKN